MLRDPHDSTDGEEDIVIEENGVIINNLNVTFTIHPKDDVVPVAAADENDDGSGNVDRQSVYSMISMRSITSAFGTARKKFARFFDSSSKDLFIDPDFPPTTESLFHIDPMAASKGESTTPDNETPPEIEWRRPSEFIDGEVTIFGGKIEWDDIVQGQLGDCWLMCALAAISEFDILVKDLFPLKDNKANNQCGLYVISLCKDGSWKRILIDSYIPCFPGEGPIYSQANGPELWVMLIEKAFAKYHGSYAAIRTGFPIEAMIDLTGSPYQEFNLTDSAVIASVENGDLWKSLLKYDAFNYIMTLSTPGVDNETEGGERVGCGLIPGHAYTLIGVHEATNLRLCKIRNPWGQFEWDGDWSDKSPLWTEQLKKDLGWCDKNEGIFWMSFADLTSHFIGINVSLLRHKSLNAEPWKEDRKKIEFKFKKENNCFNLYSIQMFILDIRENNAETFVTVHQPDKRRIGALNYLDIGVTVLKKDERGQYKLTGFVHNGNHRQQQLELTSQLMLRGTYLIVPTTTCCRINHEEASCIASDCIRSCILSVHCDKNFSIKEVPYDIVAYNAAISLPVTTLGKQSDIYGDGSVIMYTLCNGFDGNTYVAENRKKAMCAKLEFDFSRSINVITDQPTLKKTVLIPQNALRLIYHVVPADLTKTWTASWQCHGEFTVAANILPSKKEVERDESVIIVPLLEPPIDDGPKNVRSLNGTIESNSLPHENIVPVDTLYLEPSVITGTIEIIETATGADSKQEGDSKLPLYPVEHNLTMPSHQPPEVEEEVTAVHVEEICGISYYVTSMSDGSIYEQCADGTVGEALGCVANKKILFFDRKRMEAYTAFLKGVQKTEAIDSTTGPDKPKNRGVRNGKATDIYRKTSSSCCSLS